ncbi:aspartate carbamoyltransferase catalytic subunit [Rubrobacter aplysinae]|uniref:aspartate carbamoyltransferase catalytic subunit n=1 Tax=Rubrobacter aplysinae TaxID=909625 RepID=UPI00064C374B|nr:aspartate carbamoyltransferase catalytic subunit [Rubrobacter aplysinae]
MQSRECRDLISLQNVSLGELQEIIERAREHAAGDVHFGLAGHTVCLAFFESSTRTASSFELAARRAGADVVSISGEGSSLSKGESLIDTVVTLDRLGADAIVLRHPAAGAASLAARYAEAPVVNAGDGRGQHPTQALLDLYALAEAGGGFEELEGRRAAIVGDVLHSRVARSVIPAFKAAGMEVALAGPRTLLPEDAAGIWGCPVLGSVDEALAWGADTLYALRLQRERMASAEVPSVAEYAASFGVRREHLIGGVRLLHPGPVNRGVEVAGDVVLDERSLIREQVAAGIHVRSAVLEMYSGARREAAA